jgi:hypothetical protein
MLARTKQAGASSIGRYYSSSDGKYYKDHNAADVARKARVIATRAKTKPTPKPVTPPAAPKPKVVYRTTSTSRGANSKRWWINYIRNSKVSVQVTNAHGW